jgi:hypothetical protein
LLLLETLEVLEKSEEGLLLLLLGIMPSN